MIKKNIEKEERKQRRKPPIPYSRKEATKKEREERARNKYRKEMED